MVRLTYDVVCIVKILKNVATLYLCWFYWLHNHFKNFNHVKNVHFFSLFP